VAQSASVRTRPWPTRRRSCAICKDPASTKAIELGGEEVITIGADDSVSDALHTLKEHKVRRLPVIDEQWLVGVVSVADLAANIEENDLGDLVEAISAAPWRHADRVAGLIRVRFTLRPCADYLDCDDGGRCGVGIANLDAPAHERKIAMRWGFPWRA